MAGFLSIHFSCRSNPRGNRSGKWLFHPQVPPLRLSNPAPVRTGLNRDLGMDSASSADPSELTTPPTLSSREPLGCPGLERREGQLLPPAAAHRACWQLYWGQTPHTTPNNPLPQVPPPAALSLWTRQGREAAPQPACPGPPGWGLCEVSPQARSWAGEL